MHTAGILTVNLYPGTRIIMITVHTADYADTRTTERTLRETYKNSLGSDHYNKAMSTEYSYDVASPVEKH